jgi:Protein of unknown function (DUF3379)
MNCLEFRRLKLATPRDLPPQARAHALECKACAELARSIDEFERDLEAAIKVPVEPTLADRVLLNHRLRGERRRRLVALAASVLALVGLGLGFGYRALAPDPNLLSASVDHVLGESYAFKATQKVDSDALAQALGLSGARLNKSFAAAVTYLRDCPVPGGVGKHIIVATSLGKFTVLTMPNRDVHWRLQAQQKGLATAVLPAGRGSVAIVADSETALAAAEAMLNEHVAWRSKA